HWPEVAAIYDAGIRGRHATFETAAPSWEAWDAAHTIRLVALEGDRVVGWAALAPVSSRCAYEGVAEDSVYVAPGFEGRGIGRELLTRLIERAEADGIWTIQANVFPENGTSLALHEACGFRVVGFRERIGKLDGVWRDTVLLERRAP
ncbi:MAG: N-acetyltransferase family protein, partial [Actinomycetota bacterium]|nr:N-acetyltransferase family protein [Actinomycetota bacterium]